jgi:sarcosine oxidase subunit alpha
MPEIEIFINGCPVLVSSEASVAAAILDSGQTVFRRSVSGQPRAALCGMGICFECRVSIDDVLHLRSCQILCEPGMKIVTG